MQTHSKPTSNDLVGNWQPISDVPDNLEADGRNYIEWIVVATHSVQSDLWLYVWLGTEG
jgi:hypothetical protein